ncbi:MAG: hypothetical protein HY897_15455 [Deltaproteobacteria bacterium]|nr:hypothetical protein [Deltaproteobacteria bacterium]
MKTWIAGVVVAAFVGLVLLAPGVAHAEDAGSIAVVPFEARWGYSYDTELSPGMRNDEVRQILSQGFYGTGHLDQFDFLVVMTNFAFEMTEGGAPSDGFYTPVRNREKGIGWETFDYSAPFGSNSRLQGYIDLGSISGGYFNRDEKLRVLAHQLGHRWLAFPRFMDADENLSAELLGFNDSHWSFLLEPIRYEIGG